MFWHPTEVFCISISRFLHFQPTFFVNTILCRFFFYNSDKIIGKIGLHNKKRIRIPCVWLCCAFVVAGSESYCSIRWQKSVLEISQFVDSSKCYLVAHIATFHANLHSSVSRVSLERILKKLLQLYHVKITLHFGFAKNLYSKSFRYVVTVGRKNML